MTVRRRAPAVLTACILAAACLPVGAAGAQDAGTSPLRPRTVAEDLQMFSQVLNQIRVNHPDSVDTHALLIAAINGMVHAADPHSFVIPALRLDSTKRKAYEDGKLYPVPVTFAYVDEAPVVVSVEPGSRASESDILPGDELVEIDGKRVVAESAPELDITLAGAKNSTVNLTFERRRVDGTLVRLVRPVRRERTEEASGVPTAFMLDAQTGYVRITTFEGDRVADDLHDALGRLEGRGMQRLVLDLRDNGGGRVDQAARIASEFLPKGMLVYTASGRKQEVTDTVRVKRSFWRTEKNYPIVIMVNGGTASASELVAGALQDHDRAIVVGRPTFGKALLMRGFPMTDGSLIMLVIGHVQTPCGRVIQRQYRGLRRQDYYHLATAERDTADRPSCKTDGGRTVYGGGGIYPDVMLAETPVPLWLARVAEEGLTLRWAPGYVSANTAPLASLDSFAMAPKLALNTVADFRAFAASNGVTIPADTASASLLERMLLRAVARARFGDAGYYRVAAVLDDRIVQAESAFDRVHLPVALH